MKAVLFCIPVLLAAVTGRPQTEIQNADKEICMDELGCFAITSDFKSLWYRPINVLPNERAVINTKFKLYTRENTKQVQLVKASDEKGIKSSNLKANRPTLFIVHGYLDNEFFGDWMIEMKDQLLLHADYNVLIVDWSGGNGIPYYQATSNTRVVGAEIALIIQRFDKVLGIKAENCHVIGHSLGAHVAGYAGERLTRLGRITALDPAEPNFQNMPKTVRIDQGDADFVDVIHSDATTMWLMGFGMNQAVGHVDFFPNDGRNQPGCTETKITSIITDGFKEGIRRMVACNHQRSIDFFISSLNLDKPLPVAYECSKWANFLEGKCADCGDGSKCAIMGIKADEFKPYAKNDKYVKFYTKTSGKKPFFLYTYQATFKLDKNSDAKDQQGKLTITLHGEKQNFATKVNEDAQTFKHGDAYTFLLTSDTDIGEVKTVTVQWENTNSGLLDIFKKPWLYVKYVKVITMHVVEHSPRKTEGTMFCGDASHAIKAKEVYALPLDNNCKES